MKHALAVLGILLTVSPAFADFSTVPDPYAPGFGFNRPQEASWGGWTRGTAGTLYAEWDIFSDSSFGTATDRNSAPVIPGTVNSGVGAGVSMFGTTTTPFLSWNPGTILTSTSNLYNPGVAPVFTLNAAMTASSTPLHVALQTENFATAFNLSSFKLNGLSPTLTSQMFSGVIDGTDVFHNLFYWDLPSTPANLLFNFAATGPHLSLTQVALDVAPVPLPAAAWLFGSGVVGLIGLARRKMRAVA